MHLLFVHENPAMPQAASGDWGYPEFNVIGAHSEAPLDAAALAAAAAEVAAKAAAKAAGEVDDAAPDEVPPAE